MHFKDSYILENLVSISHGVKKLMLFFFLFIPFSSSVFSANITAGTSNNNWTSTHIGGTAYTSLDNITCGTWNHTYTLTSDVTIVDLNVCCNVTINLAGYTLTVTNLTLSSNDAKIDVGAGKLVINGNLSMTDYYTDGLFTSSTGIVELAGNFTASNNSNTMAGGTSGFQGTLKFIGASNPTITLNNSPIALSKLDWNCKSFSLPANFTVSSESNKGPCGTTYYSKNSQDLSTLTNWNSNTDGTSGTAPSNFTGVNDVFIVQAGHTGTFSTSRAIAGTLTVNGTLNPSAAAVISGAGTLNGSGTVKVTRTSATADFSSQYTQTTKTLTSLTVDYANSSGNQTISAVTYNNLVLSNTSGTQTAANNLTVNGTLTIAAGSTMAMGSYTLSTPTSISIAQTGQITGSGAITLGGNVTTTGGGGTTTIANPINLGGSTRTFTVADGSSSDDVILSGIISNGSVTKAGAGKLVLSGANTFTGAVAINAGIVNVRHNTGLGTTAGGVTVSDGAVLELQGGIAIGAESLSIRGTGVSNNGALRNISGDNTYGGALSLQAATEIQSDAGTLTISGNINNTQNLTFDGAGNITVSGVIGTSTGTLTKTGAGVLTLSGNNTYTGTTTITAGILQLSAADRISNSSNITLNGGTFRTGASSGYGETVGTLNLNTSSTIALGTGSHTLTFANSSGVTWAGTTLTITGWTGTAGSTGTAGKIFFGSSTGTLSAGQLAKISFTGFTGTPILLSTGELVPPITAPTITVSETTRTGFSYCHGTGPSSEQTYTVSGINLSQNIAIAAPTNYEISTSSGSGFTNSLSLTQSGGTVNTTTIYVRLKAGLAAASYNSENIVHSSTGATNKNVACSGTVTSPPTITIASSTPSVAVGNLTRSSTKNAVSAFTIASAGSDAVLNSVVFTTSGTYTTSDISNFKLWYHTSNDLVSASQIGSTISSSHGSGATITFNGFTQTIAGGATRYFWITADVAAGATLTRTLTVSAIANTALTFVCGSKSGSVSAGGEKTITAAPKNYYFVGSSDANWNDANTWRVSSCGGSIDGYPGIDDNVFFECGNNDRIVTLNGNASCASLTINKYGQKINLANYNLTVGGNVTIQTQSSSIYSSTGSSNTLSIGGNLSISGYDAKVETSGHDITIGGNVTFAAQNTNITIGDKNLSIAGTYTNTSGYDSKIQWTTGTVTIAGDITISRQNSVQPLNCTSTGWFEMNGTSQTLSVATNGITIPRFRQPTTGFTKAGASTLTVSQVFDYNCYPSYPASGVTVSVPANSTNQFCGDPDVVLSSSNPSVAAALVGQGAQKVPVYAFALAVTTNNATLTAVNFSTTNSSATDINKYQLWYSSTNSLGSASQIGSNITTSLGTGSRSFSGLTQQINVNTTGYFWITVDVTSGAAIDNTIQVSAISTADLTFSAANKSGSASAGGVQTIAVAASLTVSTASLTQFRYAVGNGPSAYKLFYVSGTNLLNAPGSITVQAPTNYIVSATPSGAYTSSITINYTSSTLTATPVYVRLKSGLSAGDYNSEAITFSGGGYAGSVTVTCSGSVGRIFYALNGDFSWTDGTKWSVVGCNGAAANEAPTWKDSVRIACDYNNSNNIITINSDVTIGGLYLERLRSLTISGTNKFEILGDLQLGVFNWTEGKGTLNVGNGTLQVHGDLTLGFNNDMTGLKWDDGSIIVGGNVNFKDGGGPSSFGLDPGSAPGENTTIKPGGPTPTYAGPFIMNGENKSINVSSYPGYHTSTWNGNVVGEMLISVEIPNLKLESSTISKTGPGTLYVTNNFDFNNQTGFVNEEGTIIVSGTITNATGTTFTNDASLKISTTTNSLLLHTGTTGSTTEFYATGAQVVNQGTYYNLTISGGGTKTLQGDISIDNVLTFSSAGYLDLNGHDITMNNWANGNITPITTADRYIISSTGSGSVFTINGVDDGETANFPIGLSASDADYCRVDIQNSSCGSATFSITGVCNTLYTNASCNGSGGSAITTGAVNLTWNIVSTCENPTVTFYWEESKELSSFSRNLCATYRNHNNTVWEIMGDNGAAVNFTGTIWKRSGVFDHFSGGAILSDDTFLPIELLSFKAVRKPLGYSLEWITASETNNDFFTLLRSNNGSEFLPIAQLQGAGTTSYSSQYSYFDESIFYGTTYYQLQQTDYDGTMSLSQIITAYNEAPNFEVISMLNPVTSRMIFELQFSDIIDTNNLRITNIIGEVIYQQEFRQSSFERIELQLPPGVYILLNQTSQSVHKIKFVVK